MDPKRTYSVAFPMCMQTSSSLPGRETAIFVFKGLPGKMFGQSHTSLSWVFIKMMEQ